MRVIVPYTDLHPEADAALSAYAPSASRVDVSGSVAAYWRVLRDAWAAGEDFAVIEHDVVISEGTIEAFEACPEPWCACGDPDWGTPQLQCVRFRAKLIAELPGALDVPPWMTHWVQQDTSLLPKLCRAGYRCHEHPQQTRHLTRPELFPAHQRAFYAWLANFATWENEMRVLEMDAGLERDRLSLALLLAPLAKFAEERCASSAPTQR